MGNIQNAIATNPSIITEKNYPITVLWIFKAPIIMLILSIAVYVFGYYLPYFIIAIPVYLILNPLTRSNFHYSLDDKYFHVRQGIFSKKQRDLPYGVIQNIFVKQDIFDRVLGLATLRIENATPGGQAKKSKWWNRRSNRSAIYGDSLGSSGNQVNLPGLKKKSAEDLKNILLQKIKENPIEESGL